ncbi:hypothetical protein L2E82_10793 [Cichorium intybus]|uniref:Uncharacterized protein n=1 Tax=Cichorium intybus TaxID=13427 RepID=A0ACB9GBE9_CICIN|nr:hypothetical protein L2E82_10793 [Cichorium intybus]
MRPEKAATPEEGEAAAARRREEEDAVMYREREGGSREREGETREIPSPKTWKRHCEVQLRCLLDNTTGKMIIVKVRYGVLRPIPPTVIVEYKVGDYVDAWDRQGWWSGVVDSVIGDDVYDVVLLDGKIVRVCDLSVRITQNFTYGSPPKWQYNKY